MMIKISNQILFLWLIIIIFEFAHSYPYYYCNVQKNDCASPVVAGSSLPGTGNGQHGAIPKTTTTTGLMFTISRGATNLVSGTDKYVAGETLSVAVTTPSGNQLLIVTDVATFPTGYCTPKTRIYPTNNGKSLTTNILMPSTGVVGVWVIWSGGGSLLLSNTFTLLAPVAVSSTSAPVVSTFTPSFQPTQVPTRFPTQVPSFQPLTAGLTYAPSTRKPTSKPTTNKPTVSPTTGSPSLLPTRLPSVQPSTTIPSSVPSTIIPTLVTTTTILTHSPSKSPIHISTMTPIASASSVQTSGYQVSSYVLGVYIGGIGGSLLIVFLFIYLIKRCDDASAKNNQNILSPTNEDSDNHNTNNSINHGETTSLARSDSYIIKDNKLLFEGQHVQHEVL